MLIPEDNKHVSWETDARKTSFCGSPSSAETHRMKTRIVHVWGRSSKFTFHPQAYLGKMRQRSVLNEVIESVLHLLKDVT